MTTKSIGTPQTDKSEKKISCAKHDKLMQHQFDVQCKEIRSQLGDQLKAFAERTETHVSVLAELEDFIKKRGEVEAEHARNLEKLAKGIMQKQKAEKNKRDSWSQHASMSVWQELVDWTKGEAEQRQGMASLLSKKLAPSVAMRAEDLQRMSKKCRDMAVLAHTELYRVMTELQTAMKTYQIVHSETAVSEKKFKIAEEELRKCEHTQAGKNSISRKHKNLQKLYSKRGEKFNEVNTRCTKARNEYILCVRAANAALHKFYADDLSSLADGADLGMDFWLQSLISEMSSARKDMAMKEMNALAELEGLRDSLDSRSDKQAFFESRPTVFMLPKPFEFHTQQGDRMNFVSAEEGLGSELEQRQKQIEKRLEGLRFESDEVWKSLKASEEKLGSIYMEGGDEDITKWRSALTDTFQYYLKKLEYFLLNENLIERLETRAKVIGSALGECPHSVAPLSDVCRVKRRTRRIAPALSNGKPTPKLFGSSLGEYCEITGEEIPLIVTSTVAFLSRFALRHQGLFRVSGSQSEINRLRESFERGEDPVSELTDASEANIVAGVLKAYLRELREPPFPLYLFDQFTSCVIVKERDDVLFIQKTRELMCRLCPSSIRLLRFVFGYFSHLCEYADENMMQPNNVAICVALTLMPIPEGKDPLLYSDYVADLVRLLIIHHESIFPPIESLPGLAYDKFVYARSDPFLTIDDDAPEEDETADEEESRRSVMESDEMAERSSFRMTESMRAKMSTDRPRILSPLGSSTPKDRLSQTASPIFSHLSFSDTSPIAPSNGREVRIPLPGMVSSDELNRREKDRWENAKGEKEKEHGGTSLFTSLREQLTHMRKDDSHSARVSPSSCDKNVSPPSVNRSSLNHPTPSPQLSNELKRLFSDSPRRSSLDQPDLVRESVRRPSPSSLSTSTVPLTSNNTSHPIHSHSINVLPSSPTVISSPGKEIDDMSAMLATLQTE